MHYEHTQFGWLTTALLGGGALIGLAVAIGLSAPAPVFPVPLLLALAALVFGRLTVRVGRDHLECAFGLGLVRRRIAFRDIAAAEKVRNAWWYGWGIRLTPHGWLWNVAGLDAVELSLRNGRRFRLGTDEPARLLAALNPQLAGSR